MKEYSVDLSRANFNFDLDLLEHVHTTLPERDGESSLLFDHQQQRLNLGEETLLTYSQVSECYWAPGERPGLELHGTDIAFRFHDPAMDAGAAREILFRLANICQWKPKDGP